MTDETKKHVVVAKKATKKSENEASKKDDTQEIGGFEKREEPTRYGDWEVDGRCSDF